jgi:hypothetical protein
MGTRSRAVAPYVRIRAFATSYPRASTLTLVLGLYWLLTVVMTYPVLPRALTEIAGSGADRFHFTWLLWWAKTALIDLHVSTANVNVFYHPYGVQLPSLVADANLMWTSVPLVILFGPLAAYNVQLLCSYVLTGFTTYLLCYSLTKKHGLSFLGGVVFAFSPWRSGRAAHGSLGLLITYWQPLYVMFLIRVFKKPNARNALFCGLFLALSVLSGFLHVAHFVIPVTAVFLVYQHFANRGLLYSVRFLRGFAAAVAFAAAIVVPIYAPILQGWAAGGLDYYYRFGAVGHSAPLLGFVVPPSSHFVVQRIEPLRLFARELLPKQYDVVYVGVVPLALAVCAGWSKRTKMWVILGALSAVLALGPLLRVGADWVEYSVSGKTGFVLLPEALLTKLPFYQWIRDPARFGELTAFSLAVLACYGVLALSRLVRGRVAQCALVGGVVACILVDYSSFLPFPTERVPIPEFYDSLAADRDVYGILDVAEGLADFRGMYFQTVHQHPIAEGFASRVPYEARLYRRFLEQLVEPNDDIINTGGLAAMLQQLEIRYVVLHKLAGTTTEGLKPFLAENLGQPVYEDDQIAAFGVPLMEAGGVSPDTRLLALGEQWHPVESIDGVPSRWMVNDGTLYVRVERDGPYQLAFVAHPFGEPRHLQAFVGEDLIAEYDVGGMQSYVTPAFALKSGEWTTITFHVPEGCQVPSQVAEGEQDDRCLSMLFQAVGILPAGPEA